MNRLELLSWVSNRRLQQTEFLYELCGNDFDKLLEVEAKLKKHHLQYCPGDMDELNKVLSLN